MEPPQLIDAPMGEISCPFFYRPLFQNSIIDWILFVSGPQALGDMVGPGLYMADFKTLQILAQVLFRIITFRMRLDGRIVASHVLGNRLPYIPLLVVALLARFTDLIKLTSPWDALESWWIIGLLVVLSLVEFFADKIPAVNHINDLIQTIVRPVAGAILFAASAQVVTEIHPILSLAAGLLVSGGVHAVKSLAVRPAVTATTGGAGNVPVSILEDILSSVVSILSVVIPIVIGCFLILVTAWLVWRMWRKANSIQTA